MNIKLERQIYYIYKRGKLIRQIHGFLSYVKFVQSLNLDEIYLSGSEVKKDTYKVIICKK